MDFVDDILFYLDTTLAEVILEDPLVIYSRIFNLPEHSKYQKYIEDKGNFKFAELFFQENVKVTQHIAVYHEDENLFEDVLTKAVSGSDSVEVFVWDSIVAQVAKHFLGILVNIF